MFCIGELTEYRGCNGNPFVGRIFQISPNRGVITWFRRSETYEYSALLFRSKRINGQPYVVYNLKETPNNPGTMIPDHVALIEEAVPDSLYRLIKNNNLDGFEIDCIIRNYCSGCIEKNATICESMPTEKEQLQKRYETIDESKIHPDEDVFRLIRQPNAFELNAWKTYDEVLKARMICRASRASTEIRNRIYLSASELLYYEKERPHTIIYALLLILFSMNSNDTGKKRDMWREAHKELLTTTALAFRNNQKNEILPILKVILPGCECNSACFCDAYLKEIKNNPENNYITCTQKNHGIRLCMESFGVMEKSVTNTIRDDRTKPHLENVANCTEAPDLRDLVEYSHFDLNVIPETPISETLDSNAYPYRISSYVMRLDEVWPYLSCKKCKCAAPLFPDFDYKEKSDVYTLTKFTCREYSGDKDAHDYQVYLNHCCECGYHQCGKQIIDSRECVRNTRPDYKGMWICMRCGGAQDYKWHRYCPACGSENIKTEIGGSVTCQEPGCGLVGSKYGHGPVAIEEIMRFDRLRVHYNIAATKEALPF